MINFELTFLYVMMYCLRLSCFYFKIFSSCCFSIICWANYFSPLSSLVHVCVCVHTFKCISSQVYFSPVPLTCLVCSYSPLITIALHQALKSDSSSSPFFSKIVSAILGASISRWLWKSSCQFLSSCLLQFWLELYCNYRSVWEEL
jgi:hypothetical protein